jgi:hypothetical protein
MKEEDMKKEKAEIDIRGVIIMIEIPEEMIGMEEDSEAEVIKNQDIIKRRVIHFILVICRTTQEKNKSNKSLNNMEKFKMLEFLTITVEHLKVLHMSNFKAKEMQRRHLTKIKLILMDEKLD